MLGVFFFFLFFTLLCLFIGLPARRKMRVISSLNEALPTPSPQEFSKSTANELAWWVKIVTETPYCTYFFGPFDSAGEAKQNQPGYIEDLQQEGAQGIGVFILQDRPETLTIYDEHE
jgi:hypothetical protein